MSKVHRIVGCDNNDRVADVVFIHGLDGDPYSTWQADNKRENFWPKWLGEEVPNVGVWSLGYAVNSTAWKGSTMPLYDCATNVLDRFSLKSIGSRPTIFVCHSLGGLLVKQMLRNAHDFNIAKYKRIADKTRGIVFLSTPHSGSYIANLMQYFALVLRSSVSLRELKLHNPHLRQLNTWFREHPQTPSIEVRIYYETKPTSGILVVDPTSADPGLPHVPVTPLDEDHTSICKPKDRDSHVYEGVKKLVIEIATQAATSTPPNIIRELLNFLIDFKPYGEAVDIFYGYIRIKYSTLSESDDRLLHIMSDLIDNQLISIDNNKVKITKQGKDWIKTHPSTQSATYNEQQSYY